jgi:hypothetical protein
MDPKRKAYELLTSEDDGRVCRDIPDEACREQPGNFLKHVLSLGATKTGDGLADPKLVLSWLLASLGAPAALIGFLVPIREAGSLLPQLVTAGAIRSLPQRKWVWAAGSLVQGLAVAGMAAVTLTREGTEAGLGILALLAVFALARSACSVSYKDVLGKTVSKSTRGTATGIASTIAASGVLLYGVLLAFGVLERTVPVVAGGLLVAAALWLFAATLFSTLGEVPGATGGGGNPLTVAREQLSMLRTDTQLVRFIAARGLLIATALAPPYLLALAGRTREQAVGELGPFVVASSLAAMTSGIWWGRLSDRSSRKVLVLAALVAAAVLSATAAIGWLRPALLAGPVALPALLFVLMVSYQGVRIGRSTHIVDMAAADRRAAYTALSNTIIGVLLVVAGSLGLLAQAAGTEAVLAVFAGMCLGAAAVAAGLREVQQED